MKVRDMQTIARGFNALVGGDYSTFFTNKVSGETLPREEAKQRMEDWFINSWNDDTYDIITRDNINFDYDRIKGWVTISGITKHKVDFKFFIQYPDQIKINGIKINLNN